MITPHVHQWVALRADHYVPDLEEVDRAIHYSVIVACVECPATKVVSRRMKAWPPGEVADEQGEEPVE